MPTPSLFIVYVSDVRAATAFYSALFEMAPKFETPRFVPFEIAEGVEFALWSGRPEAATPATPRTSEVCLNVPGGAEVIEDYFARWSRLATVVAELHDDVFGRTFLVADPDGNLIRVAPVDPAP